MQLIRQFSLLTLLVLGTASLVAQADSDILFTVGDTDVTVGEFKYIYSKSNGEEADFSRASVQEYLDLYERFKLKVARAREMGLDTVQVLQRELEGYRRQLADNYIVDRQVTDKLVRELYERQQKDIEFSHIFFPFEGNPTPADTLALYKQTMIVKKNVTPTNFAARAQELSEDKYSKDKGGRVGFLNAPFPKGMDRLEKALYEAPQGVVVGPVQTKGGYHLAIKHSSRPALGEVEVGHILVRRQKDAPMGSTVPEKIKEAQAKLRAGEDFAKVAKEYSEDGQSRDNAGYLGFFGINRYDPAFEKASFGLAKDGAVSDIVETKAGWHLIRRISRRGAIPFNDARPLLETRVKADDRFARAYEQLLQDLRMRSNLSPKEDALKAFIATLDASFLTGRWQPEVTERDDVLYTMAGGRQGTVADFQEYLTRTNRQRINLTRVAGASVDNVARALFEGWTNEALIAYAESRLEDDYPEFAALMREYREGILLFEATKMEVWDKASEDSLGLVAFYEANKSNYNWEERATVTRYVIDTRSGTDPNTVIAYAKQNGPDATLVKFGEAALQLETDNYELNRLSEMEMLEPKVGSTSIVKNDLRAGTATFFKVEALLPPAPKALDEARGYVIADYQDELERRWVETLRAQYPVKVNKKILNKIVQ